jgi:hypothetical protein
MRGLPMSVSVSLALYFAERNKGIFNNYFMTFSRSPQLVKVTGNTLLEKINNIEKADWENDTNLEVNVQRQGDQPNNNWTKPNII